MPSIFGYSLGSVGPEAGHSPVDTQGKPNPADIVMGDDIVTFMNVVNGTKLKNRSGDTWTFNNVFVYNNSSIYSNDNTAVIDGRTFNFSQELFLGIGYQSPPSINFIHGSYMFLANNENGNIVIGHPTRVFNDYMGLAPADSFYGIVEFVDNKPIWSFSDIVDVWTAFAVFCARELSFDPKDTDPYAPGGSSGTGGGTGNFDGTGDDIAIPGLPTLSAVDAGFITLFNPSISQLKSLSDYLWSGFDLNTFKKIFADPMDCILGLSIVPVSVPNGELKEVSVGNIPTGVSMTVASSQYVIVDCGTLNVNEFWGAYLDYDPYTKAEIYLPYIGTHPISVDDIMGKSVHVVYHIDILSGACTAFVKCGGSVLYEFIGQCSSSIPVTGNDWTNVINGVLSVSAAIGTMVATGGATAPMAASAIASTAVNSMKSNVEKSGSMSGTGGMMAVQTPYLILTRPRQAMPARQNEFMGYPSFITSKLGLLSGYTVVEEIHPENISGTEQELSEIENLLKTGVIL